MENKTIKINSLRIVLVLVLLVSIISIYAQDWPAFNVCCEKTSKGAWCQNTLEENCDTNHRKTPTSCDATSFCKLGCCIDSEEGLCTGNTPQKVCEISTGTWVDDSECNVPQCDLGCCVLGDQASFVTLTRCKRLSSIYGLNTNFKRNINDEASCILVAHFQDKGACVYEFEDRRTCRFTTREECLNSEETGNITGETEFFKDYLCSADELGTDCGPTTDTTCVSGKDEVYFIDSCGNPTNIYDASKTYDKNPTYWQEIVSKSEACGYNSDKGNAGSKNCGNCEYFEGSICSEGDAIHGDYICKDINCYNTENGKDYKNGESWCMYQGNVGYGSDSVGSRHFRHICINGEELIEPCADFRNEICIQNTLETPSGNFIEAGCVVNRWLDCVDQEEEEDCLNTDKRDCYWTEELGLHFTRGEQAESSSSSNVPFGGSASGVVHSVTGVELGGEVCLPTVPPGFSFWQGEESSGVCSLGNSVCIVEFEETLIGGRKCVENCECLEESWVVKTNELCTSLGDCGAYFNVVGKYTDKGAEWKHEGEKKVLTGVLGQIKKGAV